MAPPLPPKRERIDETAPPTDEQIERWTWIAVSLLHGRTKLHAPTTARMLLCLIGEVTRLRAAARKD